MGRLNPAQKKFIVKYLETGNGAASARYAYPQNQDPHVRANELLETKSVQEEIQKAFAKYDQQIDKEVGNLISIANHDPKERLQSAEPVIKANEMLLKLRGAFDRPNINLNFNVNSKMEQLSPEKAREVLENIRGKNNGVIQEIS